MAKTLFSFGSVDDVAAAVDRFAPPDATGKLKKLRDGLLEELPNKKNLNSTDASNLIAFKLYNADLNRDEINYAIEKLFVSNAYFSEMMKGVIANTIDLYPKVSIEGDGQSVFVDGSNTVDSAALTKIIEVTSPSDEEVPLEIDYVAGFDPAVGEDKTVFVQADGDGVVQESDDSEVEAVTDFSQMKLSQLKRYAKDNDIDLSGLKKQPEIIAKLIEETQARGEY